MPARHGRVAPRCPRHPSVVDAIDVSATNVRLSRRMNRFRNLRFHCGLIEDADTLLPPGAADLAYSFAVLEHVRDVDEVVAAILARLRPGGRFCFVVPMNEFVVNGDLPDCRHDDGVACQSGLLRSAPAWTVLRFPASRSRSSRLVADRYPRALTREFGSWFVGDPPNPRGPARTALLGSTPRSTRPVRRSATREPPILDRRSSNRGSAAQSAAAHTAALGRMRTARVAGPGDRRADRAARFGQASVRAT